MSGTTASFIISPQQASDIYSQTGNFPKQRNVFLVRFNINSNAGNSSSASVLTYVVKTIDRPNIEPIVEELNQYNKKRKVHTGYKKSPVKCAFYDDASGSAQKMWSDYSQYFFGDFSNYQDNGKASISTNSYLDDIYSPNYLGLDNGNFGFVAKGATNSQFFFTSIQILHFHNQIYDLYTLVNPKISAFSPDELDYEKAEVSMINATFEYEAVFFIPNYQDTGASQPEFTDGLFNGNVGGTEADTGAPTSSILGPSFFGQTLEGAFTSVEALFGSTAGLYPSASSVPNYGYYSSSPGSSLSSFGAFSFGLRNTGSSAAAVVAGSQLSSLAYENPVLAAVLGVGSSSTNPLAVNAPLVTYTQRSNYVGLPPQYPSVSASVAASMYSGGTYGTALGESIAQGIVASSLITGQAGSTGTPNTGLTLSPAALSVINSQQQGDTQYGFNPNTTATGNLYGQQGPQGVTGPVPLITSPTPQTYGGPTQAPNTASTTFTQTAPVIPVTSEDLPPPQPAVSNPNTSQDSTAYPLSSNVDPNSGVNVSDQPFILPQAP